MDKSEMICAVRAELQDVMNHEAAIMRDVLSNLEVERKALMNENPTILEGVLEERVALIEAFGKWSDRFCHAVESLNPDPDSSGQLLTHYEALEKLPEWLGHDDYDLLSFQKKLAALLKEIHHKNVQNLEISRSEHKVHEYLVALAPAPKPAKIALQLMDPDSEEL